MKHVTIKAQDRNNLEAILKRYNPPMKCCKCGRDIPMNSQVGGISCRDDTILIFCNNRECIEVTLEGIL